MGDWYDALPEQEAAKALARFPKIDAKKITAWANKLFTPYLFFQWEKGWGRVHLWSSCCMQEMTMDNPPRTFSMAEQMILNGKHNDRVLCPFCGKEATFKEVRYLGKKKRLLEYKPVVILKASRGDLYARCYWARKDYQRDLADPPLFMDTEHVRFRLGRAERWEQYYGGWHGHVTAGRYDRKISEPFTEGSGAFQQYCSYYIYGLEELEKSKLRYCQYEGFEYDKRDHEGRRLYGDFIRYMVAYCLYPRQVEMLRKAAYGWGDPLVKDLVYQGKKNAAVMRWGEDDPRKAFGLSGSEMRALLDSGASVYLIEDYKKLRRAGIAASWKTLRELERNTAEPVRKELTKLCCKHRLTPEKLLGYLDRQRNGMRWGLPVTTWRDYVTMAEALGLDMTVETVLLPPTLQRAHEEAVAEVNAQKRRLWEQEHAVELAAQLERLEQRRRKYNVTAAGWILRVAESAEEVRAEGVALEHCVGGYAERHMAGTTTILFLRPESDPDTPLYTVEMHDNTMIQIHGYKNEGIHTAAGRCAPDPRETMRWFLDPWLDWIGKGSRRDKEGKPLGLKIEKEKEKKTA